MSTRLKCALHFITILISVQEDCAVEVLQRIEYLIKRVFSKQSTFLHYRAGQSTVLTRGPLLTTHVKPSIKHSNFHIFKFRVYLISYGYWIIYEIKSLKFYFTLHLKTYRSIVYVHTCMNSIFCDALIFGAWSLAPPIPALIFIIIYHEYGINLVLYI